MPEFGSFAYYFGGVVKASESDFDGAIADFNHALRLAPDSAQAHKCRRPAMLKGNDVIG